MTFVFFFSLLTRAVSLATIDNSVLNAEFDIDISVQFSRSVVSDSL